VDKTEKDDDVDKREKDVVGGGDHLENPLH